jgi:phosphoribosylanthranilate isomerase
MIRTRVKICGITSVDDALAAVEAGADALGLVFADSPRRISPAVAAEIVRGLPAFVTTVGVFVNTPIDELHSIVEESGIDIVQLHGQERRDYIAQVRRRVLKRIHLTPDDDVLEIMERVERLGILDILFDPGAGSGLPINLDLVPYGPGDLQRVYIAGGLSATNVADVVRRKRPYAVDVSSSVEDSPGRKDAAKMRAFIAAVRSVDLECGATH